MNEIAHPYPAEKIKTIHVFGSDREIGYQHAEQLGESVKKGMPRFYYNFWKQLLSVNPDSWGERLLLQFLRTLLNRYLVPKLKKKVHCSARDRVLGVSDASGIAYEEMMIAIILPDLLPMLQSFGTRLHPSTFIDAAPLPQFSCSSFVSSGKHFLFGRNLDFPGVAYWDRYQVIQSTKKKGCLPYLAFTTAGVPFGGITGINKAQVSVALHQHYSVCSSLNGELPFLIAENILEKARTLADAREILSRARVATSWAFIVTDGKTKEAFIYECQPRAAGIRYLDPKEPILTHSNFFQTSECKPSEYATTERMNWDNYWRNFRLRELVSSLGEDLKPEDAVKFLGDNYDGYWGEEKYVNRTVSQVYNIQSLVLDVGNMMAYVAGGNAPIHLREYREYNLGEIFEGRNGQTGKVIQGYSFQDPKKQMAKEAYILSFVAAFDGKYGLALSELYRTLQCDFSAEAALVGGVLELKVGQYDRTVELLVSAKEWIEKRRAGKGLVVFPPEYFEVCIFLARAFDLQGKRSEALAVYEMIANHPELLDSNIRGIARRKGPYQEKNLKRLIMPYSTYIPFV